MFVIDDSQFQLAIFHDRLDRIFGSFKTPVGTPLTAALKSALKVDLRRSGDLTAAAKLIELTPACIAQLLSDLNFALRGHRSDFQLPLGSRVLNDDDGAIRIADEIHVLDAERPGLFPLEVTSRHAEGRNLELLRGHIRRMTARLACRRIGLPSPHHIVDNDSRPLLQFPPLAEAGGVVLQRFAYDLSAPRFRSATKEQVRDFAVDIVKDMRALWKKRKQVAARVEQLRTLLEQQIANMPGEPSIRSIDIDMSRQRTDDKFDLYVEYDAIDEAMRPGLVLDFVPAHNDLDPRWARTPYGVWGRMKERERLNRAGADGEIDPIAFDLLKVASEGATTVLTRLADCYETLTIVTTAVGPLYCTFYWQDGCIRVDATIPGRLDVFGDRVELRDCPLPETVIDALPGRTLDTVAKLPMDCHWKITGAEPLMSDGLRVQIANEDRRFVEFATGRIWR
ncbi:hypothetical protein [uncultured Sphingomonas sp.]|uniref:hypothetical protein n=1 Tax=uncultured Sphingomonas sp. TaxID=158754 RepID=UPI003748A8B9